MNEVARRDSSVEDNYILQIFRAFDNNVNAIQLAKSLVVKLGDIYRFLEPDHFSGTLIVYQTFDDLDIIPKLKKRNYLTNDFLLNNASAIIVLQVLTDGTLNLITEPVDVDKLFKNNAAVFYHFNNKKEYFSANQKRIEIKNTQNGASRYGIWFSSLCEALEHYRNTLALHSSCPFLKKAWLDKNRIFFKGGGKDLPEKYIQESLEIFLKATLRGVSVVREYNNGGSKPVDIRVSWGEAHRSALIEIKWLGKSCKPDTNKISTQYSAGRVGDGATQLKEYLDLEASDTPELITKGYLVALDGRRKGTSEGVFTVNNSNGSHYRSEDLSDQYEKFVSNIYNFEEPYIMFAMPIVSEE